MMFTSRLMASTRRRYSVYITARGRVISDLSRLWIRRSRVQAPLLALQTQELAEGHPAFRSAFCDNPSCLRRQRIAASDYKSRSPHLLKPDVPNLFHFVTVKEIDVECVAVVPVPVTVSV